MIILIVGIIGTEAMKKQNSHRKRFDTSLVANLFNGLFMGYFFSHYNYFEQLA